MMITPLAILIQSGSAAGKTSLIKLMAGLDPMASGRIRMDGEDVTKLNTQKRQITRSVHLFSPTFVAILVHTSRLSHATKETTERENEKESERERDREELGERQRQGLILFHTFHIHSVRDCHFFISFLLFR